jgi:hypothetical protein
VNSTETYDIFLQKICALKESKNLTPNALINLVLATCFTPEGIKTFREFVDQTDHDEEEDGYPIHDPSFIARVILAPANSIVQELILLKIT